MTDKELRKLRRDDLLQILIRQQRQLDEQGAELERSAEALRQRSIAIGESGSIAEAALKLNGVFEAAQAAADQFLSEARARAEEIDREAAQKKAEAERTAEDLVRSARGEADRILREARAEAERLKAEAAARPAPQIQPQESVVSAEDEGKRRRGLFGRNRKS